MCPLVSRARLPIISVVIPAKNEARNIAWVLQRVPSYVDEVIVVDGLSNDGTLEVAKMIAPDVVVIHEMTPGKGAAMRAGMDAARGDYVVVLDADGSMDPGEIDAFIGQLDAGFDLVKGSRFLGSGGSNDISLLRYAGNRVLVVLTNLLYGTRFTELCYGFMALRKTALPLLSLDAAGFEIETQIVARAIRCGIRIKEVPSWEYPRRNGVSNLHPIRDGWRVLGTILRERFAVVPPVQTPMTWGGFHSFAVPNRESAAAGVEKSVADGD
jgi:glycosyltransferase involved in cell wall biosynthesis